ncbi:hypothetical protein [Pseudarthrobacter sp. S9]|uniref:hypothetical protein n=1 Tax=Pseudarthrobacter sp. S9 TaxID=3418421 RepID=UPI003D059D75
MMRYAELRRHVWILWCEARHLHMIDSQYRRWITEQTLARVFDASVAADNAPDELAKHLAHDYRLDGTELLRFMFWWNHIMEKGFSGDNPLAHIHKGRKVPA